MKNTTRTLIILVLSLTSVYVYYRVESSYSSQSDRTRIISQAKKMDAALNQGLTNIINALNEKAHLREKIKKTPDYRSLDARVKRAKDTIDFYALPDAFTRQMNAYNTAVNNLVSYILSFK